MNIPSSSSPESTKLTGNFEPRIAIELRTTKTQESGENEFRVLLVPVRWTTICAHVWRYSWTFLFVPSSLQERTDFASALSIHASVQRARNVSSVPRKYLRPSSSLQPPPRRLTDYFLFRSLKHFCFTFISGPLFHCIMCSRLSDRFPATMGKGLAGSLGVALTVCMNTTRSARTNTPALVSAVELKFIWMLRNFQRTC